VLQVECNLQTVRQSGCLSSRLMVGFFDPRDK